MIYLTDICLALALLAIIALLMLCLPAGVWAVLLGVGFYLWWLSDNLR